MSYWISLIGPNNTLVEVERFTEGGTQQMGGSTEANLNVTYNYCKHFNFRGLHERPARETIVDLDEATQKLGTTQDPDYWAATPGNAGYACSILLDWATQHPEAVWSVH